MYILHSQIKTILVAGRCEYEYCKRVRSSFCKCFFSDFHVVSAPFDHIRRALQGTELVSCLLSCSLLSPSHMGMHLRTGPHCAGRSFVKPTLAHHAEEELRLVHEISLPYEAPFFSNQQAAVNLCDCRQQVDCGAVSIPVIARQDTSTALSLATCTRRNTSSLVRPDGVTTNLHRQSLQLPTYVLFFGPDDMHYLCTSSTKARRSIDRLSTGAHQSTGNTVCRCSLFFTLVQSEPWYCQLSAHSQHPQCS